MVGSSERVGAVGAIGLVCCPVFDAAEFGRLGNGPRGEKTQPLLHVILYLPCTPLTDPVNPMLVVSEDPFQSQSIKRSSRCILHPRLFSFGQMETQQPKCS